MYKFTEPELFGPPPASKKKIFSFEKNVSIKIYIEPDPYVIDRDNGFFPPLKEAIPDPLSTLYKDREEELSKLHEHYRDQAPFMNDDIRLIKQQQDKYELKKLLNNNLEKITLPADRPHYGPGLLVPNSVLVRNQIFERLKSIFVSLCF